MTFKKLTFVFCFLLSVLGISAQGLEFSNLQFDEALKKAQAEKKLVFVDFSTTWCGPCRMMERNVFPKKEVGDVFNKNFICLHLDAEHNGKAQADKYEVHAYPTMLFLKADGSVLNKVMGAVSAEKLIEEANKAIKLVDDPNSLANLKKRYESGDRSEEFLATYITKMKEYRESPVDAIEEYLGKQTTMQGNSSKMMEFFINNINYFALGGNAEKIFTTNEAEYRDIATKSELNKVNQVYSRMMRHTMNEALAENNVEKYKLFLNRWVTLKEKPYYQDYTGLYLDLLRLQGDTKGYHKLGVQYIDSVVSSRSIEDIHLKDEQRYKEYAKAHPGDFPTTKAMREGYKDLDAHIQLNAVAKVGHELLKNPSKKELKSIASWIAYGEKLLPDYNAIGILKAEMLYVQGDNQGATAEIEALLKKVNPTSRNGLKLKETLDSMKNKSYKF